MDVGGATLVPPRDDRGEGHQAGAFRQLMAPQPRLRLRALRDLVGVHSICVAVPDVYLSSFVGGVSVLRVDDVDVEGKRDAGLRIRTVQVRKDVAPIESGSTFIDEIR